MSHPIKCYFPEGTRNKDSGPGWWQQWSWPFWHGEMQSKRNVIKDEIDPPPSPQCSCPYLGPYVILYSFPFEGMILKTKIDLLGCGSGSQAENAKPLHNFSLRIRDKGLCCINFLLMFFREKFNGWFFKVMKYGEILTYFLLLPYGLILSFAFYTSKCGQHWMRHIKELWDEGVKKSWAKLV